MIKGDFWVNALTIDTSTKVLGVGLLKNNKVIGDMTTHIEKTHTPRLLPAIHQLMKKVEMEPGDLDKIIVGKGPGSYTGVRIGLTTAKSMAWALDIPIIAVSSLEALAYQGRFFPSYICPFIDARRKTVFTGLYKQQNGTIIQVHEDTNMLMADWLKEISADQREILFLSPNIDLFKEMIVDFCGDKSIIPEEPYHILRPAHLFLASQRYESQELHTLTPNYLRLAEAEKNWMKSKEKKNNQIKSELEE